MRECEKCDILVDGKCLICGKNHKIEKTLAIYFKDGSTAYFEKVENFELKKLTIQFDYFGVSSQTKRNAFFILDNIAGFAISE